MKSVVPLALVLLAQGRHAETLGMADAQILRMGLANWRSFYMRDDDSAVAYRVGTSLYGAALGRRNDRLLTRADARHRRLSRAIRDFGQDTVLLGDAITLGGTFWHTRGSESHVETEVAILALLRAPAQGAMSRSATNVAKEIAWLRANQIPNLERAKQALYLGRLEKDWRAIRLLVPQLPKSASGVVIKYCERTLRLAHGVVGDRTTDQVRLR